MTAEPSTCRETPQPGTQGALFQKLLESATVSGALQPTVCNRLVPQTIRSGSRHRSGDTPSQPALGGLALGFFAIPLVMRSPRKASRRSQPTTRKRAAPTWLPGRRTRCGPDTAWLVARPMPSRPHVSPDDDTVSPSLCPYHGFETLDPLVPGFGHRGLASRCVLLAVGPGEGCGPLPTVPRACSHALGSQEGGGRAPGRGRPTPWAHRSFWGSSRPRHPEATGPMPALGRREASVPAARCGWRDAFGEGTVAVMLFWGPAC